MKQAIYHGVGDIRVEDVETRDPGPKEVTVKIRYCGICGSDVHEYIHGPFPRSPFGHEACGEIVAKGSEVTSVEIGDHVLAFGPGAYAEYITSPLWGVRKLEKSLSWERAAVIEPFAGAAYAAKRAGLKPEDKLLIAGAGPVGLSILLAAKAIGVQTIYMTELSDSRTRKAEEMGATAVFNPADTKIAAKIRELTDKGVDVAIEAVGLGASLKDCLSSVRRRGRVVVHGIFTERVPVHMLGFVTQEVTMMGTNSIDLEQALQWVYAEGVELESMVSRVIPLDEISTNGFDVLATPDAQEIKILVEP
jgi:(R,R)-butanediol dehydrogenase/meso-butanediol dehydrogenase/diacetyl reductase|tara:strand:- start:1019 stop:1936 length:918 start_codon:yes stop_codon:yes gene_type:complete